MAQARRTSRFEPELSNPTTPNDAYGGAVPSEHLQAISPALLEGPRQENVSPAREQRVSIIRTPIGEFPDGVLNSRFNVFGRVQRRGLLFRSPIESVIGPELACLS